MQRVRVQATIVVEFNLDPITGWGDNDKDHVQSFIRLIQEHNPHYNHEVMKATTVLAPHQWDLPVSGEGWKLVPIKETEMYSEANKEEKEFINLGLITYKKHKLFEPSWKKKEEEDV